jgi:hypothetical protein
MRTRRRRLTAVATAALLALTAVVSAAHFHPPGPEPSGDSARLDHPSVGTTGCTLCVLSAQRSTTAVIVAAVPGPPDVATPVAPCPVGRPAPARARTRSSRAPPASTLA